MWVGIRIRSDGVLEEVARSFAVAPERLNDELKLMLHRIGPRAIARMKEAVAPNRYTGALETSISADYSDTALKVVIGPTAKRGKWDAGLLLEKGVPHKIPNAPYRPIAAWAAFRGAPMPGAWLAIRLRGVKAHPFLDRTVAALQPDLTSEIDQLATRAARTILYD